MNPAYLPIPGDLKQCAYEWFRDREPRICAAKNAPERYKRLQWLSEGSLDFHLSQFATARPPVQAELDLFAEFLASNPPRLAKRKKPLWCVKHIGGWCAMKEQPGRNRPGGSEFNVPTMCEHFITMPLDYEIRQPDCPECRATSNQ